MSNNTKVPSRHDFRLPQSNIAVMCKDRDALANNYYRTMMTRVMQLYEFDGLPDTIPKKDFLNILFMQGYCTITKVNGDLYALSGGLGGELNAYYLPTRSIVSNPYLNYYKDLEIDKDCVVILNDSMYQGLLPMFSKYSTLLASIDVSLYWANISTRMQNVYEANTDSVKKSADDVFEHLEIGDTMKVVASDTFVGKLTEHQINGSNSNSIINLIEEKQYILAQWYMELGLQANYNMKREALNENEINADTDVLVPLIDDMLEQMEIGLEKVNAMYGTNITVSLNSSWKGVRKSIEAYEEMQEDNFDKEEEIKEEETTSKTEDTKEDGEANEVDRD